VFENSCGAKISEVTDPVDFWKIKKKSVKFGRITFACEMISNLPENRNSATFTDNLAHSPIIQSFLKNHFGPLRRFE
jgi:hypothetical protein